MHEGNCIIFGAGCFWGVEKKFWALDGVTMTSHRSQEHGKEIKARRKHEQHAERKRHGRMDE